MAIQIAAACRLQTIDFCRPGASTVAMQNQRDIDPSNHQLRPLTSHGRRSNLAKASIGSKPGNQKPSASKPFAMLKKSGWHGL
jgi:hypothetical protein